MELCTTKVSEGCREGQKAAPGPRLSTRSTGAMLLSLECVSESPGRLVKFNTDFLAEHPECGSADLRWEPRNGHF